MKRSVKVAAKAVNIALVVILACAFGLATLAAFHGQITKLSQTFAQRASDFLWGVLALTFVIVVVSGFHIAVSAALDRMKDKNTSSGRDT